VVSVATRVAPVEVTSAASRNNQSNKQNVCHKELESKYQFHCIEELQTTFKMESHYFQLLLYYANFIFHVKKFLPSQTYSISESRRFSAGVKN